MAAAVLFTGAAGAAAAQAHHQASAAGEHLGTVNFLTSCSQAARPQFNRGMALLHSFEFAEAISAFNATLKTDPSCAIAYWGIALSRWGNPFAAGNRPAAQLEQGRDAADRAHSVGAMTQRERGYIDAASRLYEKFEQTDQRTRVLAYRDAMADLTARYPQDPEASIFYALALTASEEPTDKTYASRLKAGAILSKLSATQPNHPGLAHYIIHSYDVPALAGRAVDAARRYSNIAPSAPHALHMPSHTFTRLGYWQDSIDTNVASAAAARRDGSTAEELHAMDYQIYAYLQTAQDAAARRLVDSLPAIAKRFDPAAVRSAAPGSAGVFALAAMPARYTLERGAWVDAAKLEPHPSQFPYAEAMTYFARALGAARTGDTATARSAVDALQQIRDRLIKANEGYWAEQVDIERQGASAWLALAEGRKADALAQMRAAAEREDGTDKNAVTPGPLAPARELLGEMLLQLNDPAQALKEFEATLKKEPNRFRTVFGAAQAALKVGDRAAARRYYETLRTICERADKPGRPDLEEARKAL